MTGGKTFRLKRAKQKGLKPILRWSCYSGLLLLFFMIMSGGFFQKWQPILIIPLAVAVAMNEYETGAAIFGIFCGFMLDIACGNLFGMSSVWLMPGCLAVALLITNLMRINVINHIWMTAIICIIMGFMEYFFNYLIWDQPNTNIILRDFIIPSYLSAVVLSPGVYIVVKIISTKFRHKDNGNFSDVWEETEVEEPSIKK